MSLTIKTTGLEDYLEGGKGKIKVLIAGGPGAGKTRFSSFAPKPIYAACEDGLLSVADRNLPYARIESEQDMDAFLGIMEAEARKPEAQRRFETVVVDTLDAYQRTVIQRYLAKQKRAEMSGWEDWSYLDSRMNNLIGRLMLLPMNIIVLVHTKDVQVNKQDRTIIRLQGAMKEQLPADFDFVGLFDNEFDLVDGKRGMKRSIVWEPTPMADWLKARGGGLTSTPVVFAQSDFDAIRDGIRKALEGIKGSSVLQEVETEADEDDTTHVVPVTAGGPVGTGTAKKAAAKKVAAVPAAAKPNPEPVPSTDTPTMEQAVAMVEERVGGQVMQSAWGGENDAQPKPAEVADEEPEPEPETPVAEEATEPEEPTPGVVPAEGEFTTTCGGPRYTDGAPAREGVGCGKAMTVTLVSGRVTAAEEGQMPDLIEIGGLRERAFLHNACYQAARKLTN